MAIDPSIPLQVQAQPSLLSQIGAVTRLKGDLQAQQMQQYQLNQAGREQSDDAATRAAISSNTQLDPTTGMPTLNRAGAIGDLYKTAPTRALSLNQQFATQDIANAKARADYQKTQLENAKAHTDYIASHLQGILSQPTPELQQAAYTSSVNQMMKDGIVKPGEVPTQYDPEMVQRQLAQTMNQKEVLEAQSQAATAAAKTLTAQTEQKKLDASMNPQSSLYAPSAASVAMGTAPGAAQIQKGEVTQAGRKARAEESARMPGEMALARQRQKLSQGDPNSAAQLLVNGDATLSELKARGATPEFIANTLNAAHQLSGGQYNAQSSDAQFQVAKSPANVAFFGSAKSLTDKGGTLDQLAAAGRQIPQSQLPALNSLADWEKAATGNGPLAKYASTALGVADDYSKVMGGGQGSDTSRLQALNLIKANGSPAARSGAIDGIRGAVGSQLNSRIGSNPVLKRMYGDGAPSAPSGGLIRAVDPQGNLHQAPAGTPLPAGWKLQ